MPAPLPAEPNSFIGRERELRELDRLVRASRVLTLCGPGGIGKTRLALRLLASVAASPDGEFPDGVCFVELGDLTQGELVPSRVAAALGVSEEPGRPLADTVADVLEPRRPRQRRGGDVDLPSARRPAAGHRAGRGPGPGAGGRADTGPA